MSYLGLKRHHGPWLGGNDSWPPNEEVVGSIPHAGVVLTIIVHPTMMGGLGTLLYGYLKVLWGDTMSGIFKALVAS
jgi:hypothetical protein